MSGSRGLIVGIAGGSAGGKSTLVRALRRRLSGHSVVLVHHDDYYRDLSRLPLAARAVHNFDRPSALDNRRLARDLRALAAGETIQAPRYDFRTHTRRPKLSLVRPAEVVLVEGMLLLAVPMLRELLDIAVFVDAPADLRLARRIQRDLRPARDRSVASVLRQYLSTVRPMHERHVQPSRRDADLIVTDALDARQVERVARLVRRRLARRSPGAS
jgi:uridine kinase